MKAAQLGVGQQVEPYIAKLKQQEQAYRNGAITIGQYRNAMRQLPMQMTDIVTSLASGMPVWLVMVQQGGQIKDSFGGIGNSFRAVLSLITPMRIAMLGLVGVTGALAIAAYKGSKEFTEYNKQLILTGNYAGKTASQLDLLAKKLAVGGITQFSSARVLAQVVGTGAFKGSDIDLIAKTAVEMQEKVGIAVDETIRNFRKLKDEPTKASEELNKQMHYLTAAQYEYIASLESKGDKEAAARVATELYGRASQKAASEVVENLNWIGRAARDAKELVLGLGDAIASIGREKGFDVKYRYELEQINQTIEKIHKDRERSGVSDLFESGLQKSLAQKTVLENILGLHDAIVAGKQSENAAEQDAISRLEYKNKIIEEGLSKEIKRARDLVGLWREVSKAPDKWSQEEREAAVATINKRYEAKTSKQSKTRSFRPDYGTRHDEDLQKQLLALEAQTKVAREFSQTGDRIISNERKQLMLTEAQFTILDRIVNTGERQLTTDEKSLLMRRESILAGQRALAVKGDELEKQNRENKLLEERAKRVAEIEDRIRALRGSAGLTDRQYQRNIALEKADSPEQQAKLREFYQEEDDLRANWRDGVKKDSQSLKKMQRILMAKSLKHHSMPLLA
ncbi:phage tail length tape measure family protein [Providencia manganoxydans]